MGSLEEFLQNDKGNKTYPNFTAAVTHGIPKGVRKKPGKPKCKGPASQKLKLSLIIYYA